MDCLPHHEVQRMRRTLAEANVIFDDEQAEAELVSFRATKEPFVNGLASYFVLPVRPWMPVEDALDNWQRVRAADLPNSSSKPCPRKQNEEPAPKSGRKQTSK